MKKIGYMTASAAMIAAFLTPAFGAPKPFSQSPARTAQASFAHIQEQFSDISDRAFRLRELSMHDADLRRETDALQALKTDVNKVAGEVKALEAERGSLPEWQDKALSEITPMLAGVADSVTRAIQEFNVCRPGPGTNSWLTETVKVSRQAGAVSELLGNKLKIAKALDKDHRLERDLSEHAGS
jgi:hypothetical protein